MSERIYKLQPNRTLALRGFDDLGAGVALHSATADSFRVSGVFRDPADFAVLMLHDADNFYEHPRLKHLPDFDFDGLTLRFDIRTTGLIPLDSPKFPTIAWPFLEVIREDGTTARVRLSSNAVPVSDSRAAASCTFVVQAAGLKQYDRLTLWYQNLAFDYIVPAVECLFAFPSKGAGGVHTVRVQGVDYNYVETTPAAIANGVVAALASCPHVQASVDSVNPAQVLVRASRDDGSQVMVRYNGVDYPIFGVGPNAVAGALADQINGVAWTPALALIGLQAQATGASLRITALTPGVDGNMLSMYALCKNDRLKADREFAQFSGGSSEAVWRVTLPFTTLGIARVRQMWLTFAPALASGSTFSDLEWEAVFTNWKLEGPESRRKLQVAGPGSVRVEENDSWCSYTGAWREEMGFFSGGFAKAASTAGQTVTVKYSCTSVHDLYLGTSLYSDRARVAVRLDEGAETTLDCRLATPAQVNTRRCVRTGVAAGEHRVTVRLLDSAPFYFDFLEAAVAGDVPDALPANPKVSPALDYSTDHTYKLPPARIHWMFDKLGYAAPMNEYIGVFWWNQRKRVGATMPSVQVTFSGEFAAGDGVFLRVGDSEIGKSVFPADTPASIARHFAQFINGYSVAVWASVEGSVLTVTSRSAKPAYTFDFAVRKEAASGSTGTWSISGSLGTGAAGEWVVDPEQSPALNRGARDWHADMFRECAARNREITVASSMELVNPPAGFASVFLDGKPVVTDVGFGNWKSTHCAFSTAVLDYQKAVFRSIADLMAAEGLTPSLQCGEFLWWFFTNKTAQNPGGGMGFYHPEITAAAQAALGRPLQAFSGPNDEPSAADGGFLRARLRDHVSAIVAHVKSSHPTAQFEVLFPYDVNHPSPAGVHNLGGKLNRYVNFPIEWGSPGTAGFDRLKMEALDFGAWSRNLDLARTAIDFPVAQGWPAGSVRHLVPIFRAGYPWDKEVAIALAAGIAVVNLWAYDHICLYGYPVGAGGSGRAGFMG